MQKTMMGFRFNNIINRFLPFAFYEWFPSSTFEPIDTGNNSPNRIPDIWALIPKVKNGTT